MARKDWNTFVKQYPNSAGFVAAVSRSLPNGPHFDKKNRKLPTPYGLFQEWLQSALMGDWSATRVPGGFMVRVATKQDAERILRAFPATGRARTTPACRRTIPFSYRDASYGALAKQLGYVLHGRNP